MAVYIRNVFAWQRHLNYILHPLVNCLHFSLLFLQLEQYVELLILMVFVQRILEAFVSRRTLPLFDRREVSHGLVLTINSLMAEELASRCRLRRIFCALLVVFFRNVFRTLLLL